MPKSKGFVYVYSVGQIDSMLVKIKSSGRPEKLTFEYAKNTWLLKNAQFSAVIDLLKEMKFLSSNGTPTDLYAEYQNDKLSKTAIAKGIHNAFSGLLKAYPKAYSLTKSDLEGYIKQQTGADNSVVSKIYGTIKKLFSLADFSSGIQLDKDEDNDQLPGTKDNKFFPKSGESFIPITMNIEIVIPSDATPEIYDQIFASIKKNLMN